MSRPHRVVGSHLLVVFAFGTVLLPWVVGLLLGLPDVSWALGVLSIVLSIGFGYSLVREVVLLWRLPAGSITLWTSALIALLGAWFALVASGPLFEGSLRAKPLGACSALLALSLLALAGRNIVRVRRGGPQPPIAPSPVDLPAQSS